MALDDFGGYAIRGYRSFGNADLQMIGPLSRIHLVVGRNNVGKSNALRFVTTTLDALRNSPTQSGERYFPQPLDRPDGWSGPRTVSFALRRTDEVMEPVAKVRQLLEPILSTHPFRRGTDDLIWFDFTTDPRNDEMSISHRQFGLIDEEQLATAIWQNLLREASAALTSSSSSDPRPNWEGILRSWAPWQFLPPFHQVDTFRRITHEDEETGGQSTGRGLVASLARLQNPNYENQKIDEAKWAALQDFVRAVLDDQSARVRIPDRKDTILVATDSKDPMPIDNLGTGIAEVIVLAAACTLRDNTMVCIEEPELHLHPTIQRMPIQYLATETSNRYLISTHSAALLNAELASITHLTKVDGWTVADNVIDRQTLSRAVSDLGARASDIVQANFIVWVEGPTDRLYISNWLAKLDPELIESAHYSIMFYGGSVLNHLSANDQETNELVELLNINRNLAVVIDSDMKSASASINQTKQRVVDELKTIDGMAWVTEGYTIENYLPRSVLRESVDRVYPSKTYSLPTGRWKSPLGKKFDGENASPSKVMIARDIIINSSALPANDHLVSHLRDLSARIRRSNGLPELDFASDAPGV